MLIRLLSTLLIAAAASPHLLAEAKPNVLFIVCDDLNNNLGCYGQQVVKSPNIDRLARRGVRFDRAYCQYPVCHPSRVSFLSGRRPQTTGIVDNVTPTRAKLTDAVFLPQHFRQQGYTTIKVGKIFHTGDGYEDPASWDSDLRETPDAKKPPAKQLASPGRGQGIMLDAPDEETYDGKLARLAVNFLEKVSGGSRPFFLAVGFRRPHAPYIAPRRYFDLYPSEKMLPCEEPLDHLLGIPRVALTYKPEDKQPSPEQWRDIIAAYSASISFVDAQVGVVLDAVDRLNLWDRTIVVFLSDHGYHLGEHGGLWHKMTLFEEAARVPLIVAAPGKLTGAVSPRLVELVDLYPTLAEACALPCPAFLEGTSFIPLLETPEKAWKRAAFTEVSRGGALVATQKLDATKMGRSVRTERWRFTEWHTGERELYDHRTDPREYRNLALEAGQSKIVAELRAMLDAGWQAAPPRR